MSQENGGDSKRVFTALSKYDGSNMIKKIARQSSGCIAISEMQKQFIKDAYRVRSAKNLANFYPNREDYDPTP